MKMNMKLAAIMLAATSIFAVTSCDSNGSGEETKTDETVEIKIGSITVTENSATVTGTLKVGKDVPSGTAIGIEYSTNEAFPVNDRKKAKVNADSEGKFSNEIKNLESDKDYFVRTYVCKDGKNYEYGTPQKFHTNKASTGGGDQGGDRLRAQRRPAQPDQALRRFDDRLHTHQAHRAAGEQGERRRFGHRGRKGPRQDG